MSSSKTALLFVLGLALAGAAAQAQAQAVGRVLLAAGDAFALRDGKQLRLAFGSPVEAKDVLRTGAASSLQVRFADEGLISLRENSEFAIEEYRFGGREDGSERGLFRLVRGGFRAVTGIIGRTQHDNYKVRTETATIGIRGTDYAVRDCRGDCGAGVRNGLYGTVLGMSSGTNQVTVSNKTGEHAFGINQHFHVADFNSRPQPLLQPPSFVAVRPQGRAQAAQQGGSGTGGEQAGGTSGVSGESRPQSVVDTGAALTRTTLIDPYTITNTSTTGGQSALLPLGDVAFVGCSHSVDPGCGGGVASFSSISFASQGSLEVVTAVRNVFVDLDDPNPGFITAIKGSGSVLDAGCINASAPGCFVSSTDQSFKAWFGRWDSGSFTDKDGTVTPLSPGNMGFHYLGATGTTPFDAITAKSGMALFASSGGLGTSPTSNTGQVGGGFSGAMQVNFGANPSATITGMSWNIGLATYTFTGVPLAIRPELGGRLATLDFEGTVGPAGSVGGGNPTVVQGSPSCMGSPGACATTFSNLRVNGAFVGQSARHAGTSIETQNGSVTTGQVRVWQCVSGAC